jgi:hypothetical protein
VIPGSAFISRGFRVHPTEVLLPGGMFGFGGKMSGKEVGIKSDDLSPVYDSCDIYEKNWKEE